ncbi:hypothetical protein [Methanoculleus bourgensis]|nr:hypothetical protein [Methanoculleus bourgensis]
MRRSTPIRIFSLLLLLAVAVPAVQAALVVDAGATAPHSPESRSQSSPPTTTQTSPTH